MHDGSTVKRRRVSGRTEARASLAWDEDAIEFSRQMAFPNGSQIFLQWASGRRRREGRVMPVQNFSRSNICRWQLWS